MTCSTDRCTKWITIDIEDIEEDRSFEARISTILFIAALEDAKDLITAQILKRRNEQQTKAAEDRTLRDKQREVDERESHSDSTKLLLEELGNMRGQTKTNAYL